jgi:phospholipid/cholesterol/gamma-HCH transport system permease protein
MSPFTFFFHLGRYLMLMQKVLRRSEKSSIFWQQVRDEFNQLGTGSLWIVLIISVFMGAVVAIQIAFNVDNPLLPRYTVGYITAQSIILEFSPTIMALILAGKVGSRISSEIGTMRVTEQIDALEIMGINSANYLILPKIVAALFANPLLIIISMFLGVFGGWAAVSFTGIYNAGDYIFGIQSYFETLQVIYALTKTVVFAFLITSISGYHGYYTSGGALEVGKASTRAVVSSCIMIICFNLILTQLFLG